MALRLYTNLISSVAFPLHERFKRHTSVSVRRAMEESQWWPAARIERHAQQRLAALLAHAQEFVPHYRQLFAENGLRFDRAEPVSGFERIPFLTKPIIRENVDSLKSTRASTLTRSNTGGSSGEPLVFYMGRERVTHDVAAKWRATRWWGVDIGDREIVVWGSPIELGAQDYLRRFRDLLLRTELLPAFEMTAANLDGFIARIRKMKPKMLFGYPSALAHIARHAAARGVRMDDLGIIVAFVTSERLYDDQRESIARAFGCRVANGYGGRDAGFIAHECPAGSMHVTSEDIIVEIIGADGQPAERGGAGEIVVTHLATKDFPFIRYRTGDVGILDDEPCSCGRSLQVLKEIQGRTTDFIVALDGTVMHGLALIYVMRDLPGIANFKIIQESREFVRVLLVPGDGLTQSVEARIVEGFKARLGADVRVGIETLAVLPAESSGKHRYVVSHVAS